MSRSDKKEFFMNVLESFKKFLLGQQAYSGFRMTLGTLAPGVLLVIFLKQPADGISCALGAFCICLLDIPAPLWRKHRHMLAGTLVIGVVSALSILAVPYVIAFWAVLLMVCFLAGLATAYGLLPTSMGVSAMLAVALMMSERSEGADLWSYLTWLVVGGLWYTYFCLITCRLFQQQMARRALAECMFATADYLHTRSQCYMPEIPLEHCYRDMIAAQVRVIDAQQEARTLVLANMFVGRHLSDDPNRIRLFNILTDLVDMHDSVLAMQVNYESLRGEFSKTDANDFMRDLLRKISQQLTRVAEALVTGAPLLFHFSVKAELRALEYEVQRAANSPVQSVLELAYLRGRSISGMMKKLVADLNSSSNTSILPLDVIEKKYFQPDTDLPGFYWSIPGFRYALRLTLAVALGMTISELLGGHSIWIVITIMLVLRPGFGLAQQRNKHRLIGTMLGCAALQLVLWTVAKPSSLFWIMAVSFLMVFCFLRIKYVISVFFATVAILLTYHFIAPDQTLIGQRAIDTLIGTVIGGIAGYVFPSWEFELMAPQIAALLKGCRRFAVQVFKSGFDEVDYRLARRDALVALTALSASHQRMLLEPIQRQVQAGEVAELVMQCNLLVSEIASLAHVRRDQPAIAATSEFALARLQIDALLTASPGHDQAASTRIHAPVLVAMLTAAQNMMRLSQAMALPGMRNTLKAIRATMPGASRF